MRRSPPGMSAQWQWSLISATVESNRIPIYICCAHVTDSDGPSDYRHQFTVSIALDSMALLLAPGWCTYLICTALLTLLPPLHQRGCHLHQPLCPLHRHESRTNESVTILSMHACRGSRDICLYLDVHEKLSRIALHPMHVR